MTIAHGLRIVTFCTLSIWPFRQGAAAEPSEITETLLPIDAFYIDGQWIVPISSTETSSTLLLDISPEGMLLRIDKIQANVASLARCDDDVYFAATTPKCSYIGKLTGRNHITKLLETQQPIWGIEIAPNCSKALFSQTHPGFGGRQVGYCKL